MIAAKLLGLAVVVVPLLYGCGTTEPLKPRPLDLKTATCKVPDYPSEAADQGTEGVTTVVMTVDETGRVTHAIVVKKSGPTVFHTDLDQAALAAAKGCVFAPAPGFGPVNARRNFRWVLE